MSKKVLIGISSGERFQIENLQEVNGNKHQTVFTGKGEELLVKTSELLFAYTVDDIPETIH